MDIRNAKKVILQSISGNNPITQDIFRNEQEKNRASKIVEQLEGLTIREAQEFLTRVSNALIDAQTIDLSSRLKQQMEN